MRVHSIDQSIGTCIESVRAVRTGKRVGDVIDLEDVEDDEAEAHVGDAGPDAREERTPGVHEASGRRLRHLHTRSIESSRCA